LKRSLHNIQTWNGTVRGPSSSSWRGGGRKGGKNAQGTNTEGVLGRSRLLVWREKEDLALVYSTPQSNNRASQRVSPGGLCDKKKAKQKKLPTHQAIKEKPEPNGSADCEKKLDQRELITDN